MCFVRIRLAPTSGDTNVAQDQLPPPDNPSWSSFAAEWKPRLLHPRFRPYVLINAAFLMPLIICGFYIRELYSLDIALGRAGYGPLLSVIAIAYGIVWILLAFRVLFRFEKELLSAGCKCCVGCMYDLRQLPPETELCPECGRLIDWVEVHEMWNGIPIEKWPRSIRWLHRSKNRAKGLKRRSPRE